MKKLAFVLAASFIANVASSQIAYVMLNEVENVVLDRYGIDYTGAHVRYMVETGEVNNLKDPAHKDSMLAAYNRFTKWNKGYFKSIPDTVYFSDGEEYMSGKQAADDFLIRIFGNSRKIIGMFSLDVNDFTNNIQTIEILELYNTGMPNYIDHIIMIKDFNSRWSLLIYNSIDIGSDCPQCPIS
jgi:hypothetical protein